MTGNAPTRQPTLEEELLQTRAALAAATEAARAAEERANELYTDLLRSQAEARAANQESDSLLDGLRVLTEALDFEQILSGLLAVLRGVLVFEHALVLMGRDGAPLRVVATSDARFADSAWQPGAFFRRVLDGEVVAGQDVRQIPEWQAQTPAIRAAATSALHASIGPPGIEAMLICTHSRRGFFTKRHVDLAGRFVALAAQALQNANLFAAVKQERDRLEERVTRRTAELTEQRDFALQVMNNIAQGLSVVDEAGRFEYVNPAYARLLGYEPAAMRGLTPYDVTLAEDHEVLREANERRRGGATVTYETRLRGADGSVVFALVTAAPRRRAGEPDGTIAVTTDLTERRRMEDALRQSEAYRRLIIDTALDAVITIDAVGLVTGWNRQAELMFGWPTDEAMGQPLGELIMPASLRAQYAEGLDHFLETGSGAALNRRTEMAALHRDGHEFPIELSITPLQGDNGVTFSAFVRDITERNRAEAALRQAKELAEQAAEAKAEFLASMSHEIRTPLNAIIGLTGLLLETELGPLQRDYAATVRSSGQVLLSIINDILDYSKFEAGHLELERQAFDLARFLAETIELLRNEAREKGLALRVDLEEGTPPYVVGDVTRLRQVLVNLLSNGIKFTEKGGVTVSLAHVPESGGRLLLHFWVRDTGIGIPPERKDRLFQPFTQLDASTTRKYGGTGLGLAICRQLVEAMGGRIWAESEPGVGTTFHFTILTRAAGPEDLPRTGSLLPLPALPDSLPPLRILVAEDNAINQKVALYMLSRLGYRADVVGNGLEVLRALRRQPYDVVLMDEQMPEMDGVSATAAIRAEWKPERRPRVVAMTASALEGDRERLLAAGMDDYVSKPVLIEELAAALIRAGSASSRPEGVVEGARPAPSPCPIDEAGFAERLGDDGGMLLAQLLPLFLAEADGLMPQLQAALADGNAERVRQAAHRLKGSGADVAATQFARAAASLEVLAKAGELDAAAPQARVLAHELERVRHWQREKAGAPTRGVDDATP